MQEQQGVTYDKNKKYPSKWAAEAYCNRWTWGIGVQYRRATLAAWLDVQLGPWRVSVGRVIKWCTEPGETTHQQETAEHIHDWCHSEIRAQEDWIAGHKAEVVEQAATIAALREAILKHVAVVGFDAASLTWKCPDCSGVAWADAEEMEHDALCGVPALQAALAQPIPPAAAKLLAERDAGRALFRAVEVWDATLSDYCDGPERDAVRQAVEAYRKVVDAHRP